MSIFTIARKKITDKTSAHEVAMNGKVVATSAKRDDAEAVAALFDKYGVDSLAKFRALPNVVRCAFIAATGKAEPSF